MTGATAKEEAPLQPTEQDERGVPISANDRKEIEKLYEHIRQGKAKLVSPDGEVRLLPSSLHLFLIELIGLLREGKSVYLIQNQAKLTTVEAAAMLGVSRQFLINLLNKNEIPYHMVGTHRRIYAKDLLRYKTQRDERRHNALRELVKAEAAEGLYGQTTSVDED
jgi:excisionase family DNA binding protein